MRGRGARIEDFLAALPHARRRLLMLDYDGTLAPFRAERDEAAPYPGVVDLLQTLTQTGDPHRADHGTAGDRHGRPAGGRSSARDMGRARAGTALPRRPAGADRGATGRGPSPGTGRALGREPGFRGLRRSQAGRAGAALAGSRAQHGGHATPGRVRRFARSSPAKATWSCASSMVGWNSGRPVPTRATWSGGCWTRSLPRMPRSSLACRAPDDDPPSPTRLAAAFLGDDFTDEDAFRAIKAARDEPRFADTVLLGVLVRSEDRPTDADDRLRPPQELLAFLARWVEAAARSRASRGDPLPSGHPGGVAAGVCHQGPR